MRAERLSAPRIPRMRGTFSSVVNDERSMDSMPGTRPWKMGRSGSRSKRSTSIVPRSLVSMTTGIPSSLARTRRSTFMARSSHSSMHRSSLPSPSRNASRFSAVTPSEKHWTSR